MITTILSDFSRVLLFPSDDSYSGSLNGLNRDLIEKFGEDYKFFDYFKMNDELLELYKNLKQKYPIFIFTSKDIQNRPEVRKIIDPIVTGIFSAKDLGVSKKDPKAYSLIAEKLGKNPSEILYIDDLLDNVEVAKKAEMSVIHYASFEDFNEKKDKYLN